MSGKSGLATDALAGSETAARLADYSGSQYYYLAGQSTVAAELSNQSGTAMSDVANLNMLSESGSAKDAVASKDHKSDNAGKDPAKVCVFAIHLLFVNSIIYQCQSM